jgi:polyphosphate glucokinase
METIQRRELALGIDIGGSGIKGAIVDVAAGAFFSERLRIPTPQPATPKQVAGVVSAITDHFEWKGPIGCGFPAVIQSGIARTAANVDSSWIGTDAEALFSDATGQKVAVLNDADAAGLAELRYGAGQGLEGVVMLVTLGTGIGTALFIDGTLHPNTELGHLELNGLECERYAASSVRKSQDLSWEEWASRLNEVLNLYRRLLWPDVFIIGGGISKKHSKFFPHLNVSAKLLPAEMRNRAGIIGAAASAYRK